MSIKLQKYSLTMRFLHWIAALLLINQIIAGLLLKNMPQNIKMDITLMHKSFGLIILFLMIFRIVIRIWRGYPSLNNIGISNIEIKIAYTTHLMMYFCVFTIAISGYLMSNAAGFPVSMFGISMPTIVLDQSLAIKFYMIHRFTSYFFIFLLTIHILGVVKNIFWNKVNNLTKMI